jgi:regulator of sirC expression with transglutaminase-like and TPR domain
MHHFQGDTKNYYSPVNSCINVVMESKKGNPLVISLIYSIIAQKLDLPIYGVNLPNHFILAYMDDKGTGFLSNTQNEYGVLFYINAFSKGSVFDAAEIKSFLDELKLSYERTFFEPCSNTSIIMRMINNLIASYQQIGNAEKVEALIRLKEILD